MRLKNPLLLYWSTHNVERFKHLGFFFNIDLRCKEIEIRETYLNEERNEKPSTTTSVKIFSAVVCLIYNSRPIDVVCIELLCSRVFTNRDCQKDESCLFYYFNYSCQYYQKPKTSCRQLTAIISYVLRIDFFFSLPNTLLARPFQDRRYDFAIEWNYSF